MAKKATAHDAEVILKLYDLRREAEMRKDGYPAYITSAGWMGYPDDLVRKLCREARAAGWTRFKIKVVRDSDENVRRAALVREVHRFRAAATVSG